MVAADQIHPPPDRPETKEPPNTNTTKDDNKCQNTGKVLVKCDTPNLSTQTESSVKPTNQKVHPTVSNL